MEQIQMFFKIFKWLIAIIFVLIGLNIYQVYKSYETSNSITGQFEMVNSYHGDNNTNQETLKVE